MATKSFQKTDIDKDTSDFYLAADEIFNAAGENLLDTTSRSIIIETYGVLIAV